MSSPKSDRWRDLAEKFIKIPDPHAGLYADCEAISSREHGLISVDWEVHAADRSIKLEFEALARRAGMELNDPKTDPRDAWLEALKEDRRFYDPDAYNTYTLPSQDGRAEIHQHWRIKNLAAISADLCKVRENQALHHEAMVRQSSDPRNWSAVRARWEASKNVSKAIKQQITRPHEEIPEEFIRGVIAEQLGINPEQVTAKQIQFEVSGLLQAYPSIRVITASAAHPKAEITEEPKSSTETVGAQIRRLRDECRWTIEQLAEATGRDERTVRRHEGGKVEPYLRTLGSYEKVFSKKLGRKVFIKKMP